MVQKCQSKIDNSSNQSTSLHSRLQVLKKMSMSKLSKMSFGQTQLARNFDIHLKVLFLISQIFFARSIKLLSCCSGGKVIPFEHGWSYRKNSNVGKFVFPYWFIHKNFRLVRGPVFCPVSGFCTSDGPIEKIPMQANLYSHTGLSIKISG